MSYLPRSVSVDGRTPAYVSPFTCGGLLNLSAPAAAAYDAKNRAFYYPITVPSNCVLDKFWVGLSVTLTIRAVAYGNGTWVAVGDSGLLLTSTDSVTWTRRTSGVSVQLNGVAYGNSKWVVVGNSNTVRYATDPTGTWTAATSPGFASHVLGVAYDGSTNWVAVGASGAVRYATDPTGTWTASSSPGFGTNNVNAVTFGNSKWVAVGNSGSVRYATDPTGTWTAATSPGFGLQVQGVAYDGSTNWVAVGASGVRYATDPTGTWTAATSSGGFGGKIVLGVAYGNSKWVAVGDGGSVRYATDPTGTWTAATAPGFGTNTVYGVAYDGSTNWVAVASNGNLRYASDPTATWAGVGATAQMGIYRADGTSLKLGSSIDLTPYSSLPGLVYDDVADTPIPAGTYYLALWSNDGGAFLFFRSSSAANRSRARFIEDGLTSGLPSSITAAQETTGLVYLFGFTTK